MAITEGQDPIPTPEPDVPLSREQREKNVYLALLRELPKLYPNAFEKIVDGNNREIITTEVVGNPGVSLNINRVIICEKGIFGLHRDNNIPTNGINYPGFLDAVTKFGPDYGKGETKNGWEPLFPTQVLSPEYSAPYSRTESMVTFLKLDPTSEEHRNQLQYVFSINEEAASQRKEQERLLNEKWDPKKILEDFKPRSS